MLTLNYIKEFAFLHADIAYILIIIGVILEGEFVVILAGIFIHLGSINIFITIGTIFLGGGIKSFLGYNLGSYLQRKHSHLKLLATIDERINRFFPHFEKHPFWSIFLSRFLMFSLYSFALIFTGYKNTYIKTFIKAEIYSLIVWTTVMLSIGYFLSYAAFSISRNIRNFFGVIILFFIGFFILEKIISFLIKLFEAKKI